MQISDSESAANQFEEWCKTMRVPVPFFRFSPQLEEAVSPGETNDDKLIDLMIKTKLYLRQEVHVVYVHGCNLCVHVLYMNVLFVYMCPCMLVRWSIEYAAIFFQFLFSIFVPDLISLTVFQHPTCLS